VSGLLDEVLVSEVSEFTGNLIAKIKTEDKDILQTISRDGVVSEELEEKIKKVVNDFKEEFFLNHEKETDDKPESH
jgi:F-type H+-transporting ATPase subunit alpha